MHVTFAAVDGMGIADMERGVPIRSISRTIAALKAINRFGSLSMVEISRASEVPYPTAFRIVQTLMYEGLIEQEPVRKRYRPTALVHALAHGFQQDDQLVRIARPHLISLTRDVGWPIAIATRVGRNMILRDSTHASTSLTFENYYPGFTFPLLECASGRLSLACIPDEEREMVLSWMESANDVGHEYLKQIKISLNVERIRQMGYTVQPRNYHDLTPGKTSSIAVPIRMNGVYLAALTLTFFFSAMKLGAAVESYLESLFRTAAAIGEDLASSGHNQPLNRPGFVGGSDS